MKQHTLLIHRLMRGVLLSACIMLTACVSDSGYYGQRIIPSGKDFNKDNLSKVQLGESTKSECVGWFGEPNTTEEIKREYADFVLYNYAYSLYDLYLNKPVGMRLLQIEFVGDVINSYFYASSFDENRKHIDFSVVDKFEKGVTTMDDVMFELGFPNGKARHPTNSQVFQDMRSYEELVWIREIIGATEIVTHTVKVGFDAEMKMMYANTSKKTRKL